MIVRIFLVVMALVSIANAARDLPKLWVLTLPAADFLRVDGQVVSTDKYVDHIPGQEGRPSSALHLYAVRFAYSADGVARTADSMSPVCSYCERNVVRRVTGQDPDVIAAGMPVPVYVRRSDPGQAFLELPRRSDFWSRLRMASLWLVVFPAFALWVAKIWPHGSTKNDENNHV